MSGRWPDFQSWGPSGTPGKPSIALKADGAGIAMKLTSSVGNVIRRASLPLLRNLPIERWPKLPANLLEIHVPQDVVPSPTKTPAGGVNIKIVFRLLEQTRDVKGDVAECGVYRGSTLIPMALYLKQHSIRKSVLGFDSFDGFNESVNFDIRLGGKDLNDKRVGAFSDTSYDVVNRRLTKFGLAFTVGLVKGYFRDSLPKYDGWRFSFVHLDCDLYQSYKDCLEFFYSHMSPGGIVLMDEYNDPPWPGCNKAVDEFLADKPERLIEITEDNFQKWYFQKL
jgi:O-methyltransferase